MLRQYLPKFIIHLLEYISRTKIYGIIPLNATLHFLISTSITIFLIRRKVKPHHAFFFILLLGLAKEVFDSYALGNTMAKHIRDMVINLTFPTLVIVVHYIKNKAKEQKALKSSEENF